MNKVLAISLVAIIGVSGGGAYILKDSEVNLSEYVPEQVSSFVTDMSEYLPDSFKTHEDPVDQEIVVENSEVFVDEISSIDEEVLDSNIEGRQIEEHQEVQSVDTTDENVIEVEADPQLQEIKVVESTIDQEVEKDNEQFLEELKAGYDSLKSDEDAVEIAMMEIQKSLNEISKTEGDVNKNSEAKRIEGEIANAAIKIHRLDKENKKLEEKFQKIMRKNRELANKLQKINMMLAQVN